VAGPNGSSVRAGTAGPTGRPAGAGDGILVVDKPSGWTSHDVVARIRGLAGTRRVGHAGTLDPMATGVLVVGVGRATRLLGHISSHTKAYTGTIRLGWATVSDDAEGERTIGAPADGLRTADLLAAVDRLTGAILQRPSAVSAIKVDGRRAHERVRSGEAVELAARPVVVSVLDVRDARRRPDLAALDVDVEVECSSGTYVRALARDLGELLGVGGHLTALRRTRVGGFTVDESRTLDDLAAERAATGSLTLIDLAEAAGSAFPMVAVSPRDEAAVRHGRPIDLGRVWAPFRDVVEAARLDGGPCERAWSDHVEPHALFSDAGQFLALAVPNPDTTTRYLAVFAEPR